MRTLLIVHLFVSAFLFSCLARGQVQEAGAQTLAKDTPVGRWRTVDDATGKVTSVLVVWEESGKLYGKIEKLVNPDPQDPNPRCVHCQGEMKDKLIVGLRILWDLRKDGDQWSGGKVLDPDNGKVYKCHIALEDGGHKLKVRGFIGFSLLGRTEVWLRDE